MIESKYNLVCKAGHKHYAPQPELWKGKLCSAPLSRTGEHGRRCQHEMKLMPKAR